MIAFVVFVFVFQY